MSMGSLISIHEVVADSVVKKVLGKDAKTAIDTAKKFREKYGAGDEFLERVYDNDPNELSYICNIPDDGEDQFQKDYDNLYKTLADTAKAFQKVTGLKGLYLVFNVPEDRYDDIDGYAWALPHNSIYAFTPAYKKFRQAFNTDTQFSQVVKFG